MSPWMSRICTKECSYWGWCRRCLRILDGACLCDALVLRGKNEWNGPTSKTVLLGKILSSSHTNFPDGLLISFAQQQLRSSERTCASVRNDLVVALDSDTPEQAFKSNFGNTKLTRASPGPGRRVTRVAGLPVDVSPAHQRVGQNPRYEIGR